MKIAWILLPVFMCASACAAEIVESKYYRYPPDPAAPVKYSVTCVSEETGSRGVSVLNYGLDVWSDRDGLLARVRDVRWHARPDEARDEAGDQAGVLLRIALSPNGKAGMRSPVDSLWANELERSVLPVLFVEFDPSVEQVPGASWGPAHVDDPSRFSAPPRNTMWRLLDVSKGLRGRSIGVFCSSVVDSLDLENRPRSSADRFIQSHYDYDAKRVRSGRLSYRLEENIDRLTGNPGRFFYCVISVADVTR